MLSKQRVGCVVNGLNYECASEVENGNRISVMELNDLMIQQCNRDFPENQYDEREEIDGPYQIELSFQQSDLEKPSNCQLAEQSAKILEKELQEHSWKM